MFSIRKAISEASDNIQLCAGKQLVKIAEKLEAGNTTPMDILGALGIKYVVETVGDKQIIKFTCNEINTSDKLECTYDGEVFTRQCYKGDEKIGEPSKYPCSNCGLFFMALMYAINYKSNLVQSLTYFSENKANRLLKVGLTAILALPSDKKSDTINTEEQIGTICYKEVPEINGYYLWEPVRGGVSAIVNRNGEKLYAGSAISFEEHLKAFKEGRRS